MTTNNINSFAINYLALIFVLRLLDIASCAQEIPSTFHKKGVIEAPVSLVVPPFDPGVRLYQSPVRLVDVIYSFV